jgi:hypothetical protein
MKSDNEEFRTRIWKLARQGYFTTKSKEGKRDRSNQGSGGSNVRTDVRG